MHCNSERKFSVGKSAEVMKPSLAHVQKTQGGCSRRSVLGRGHALDVALVHRSLGILANSSASSKCLSSHGSCHRPASHARVATGIATPLWFQVFHTRSHLHTSIIIIYRDLNRSLWIHEVCLHATSHVRFKHYVSIQRAVARSCCTT